jgi:hypothetical protein
MIIERSNLSYIGGDGVIGVGNDLIMIGESIMRVEIIEGREKFVVLVNAGNLGRRRGYGGRHNETR